MAARRSAFSRLIAWLIGLVVLGAFILFALDNRGSLVLGLWPVPVKYSLPIYVWMLGAVLVGFLFGGIAAWISGHRKRAELGRARAQIQRLQDENADLQRRLTAAETAQRPPLGPPVGAPTAADQARRQLVVANS